MSEDVAPPEAENRVSEIGLLARFVFEAYKGALVARKPVQPKDVKEFPFGT